MPCAVYLESLALARRAACLAAGVGTKLHLVPAACPAFAPRHRAVANYTVLARQRLLVAVERWRRGLFHQNFFIGAHAAVSGLPVLTRDTRRYASYFCTVKLVAPD